MESKKLLIINRGEIAIRIIRAAREMGITSVAVYSEDDAESPHVRLADEAYSLGGSGADSYLDIDRLISIAKKTDCYAIHPGCDLHRRGPYGEGFSLSEPGDVRVSRGYHR